MNAIAIALHLVSVVIWVGGMGFAYLILRPSLTRIDQSRRLMLWREVLARFLPLAGIAVLTILLSGYWLMFRVYGGFASPVWYIHIMHGVGLLMAMLYLWLLTRPWRVFRLAVAQENWQGAVTALDRIRLMVFTNLVLGLCLIAIVSAGRYLPIA